MNSILDIKIIPRFGQGSHKCFVDLRLLWILNTSFRFFIQLLCLLFCCSIVVSVVFQIAFLTVCAALWRNKEC